MPEEVTVYRRADLLLFKLTFGAGGVLVKAGSALPGSARLPKSGTV